MKSKVTGYDYGECEICNATLQEKLIKQDFWIRDGLIIAGDTTYWSASSMWRKNR